MPYGKAVLAVGEDVANLGYAPKADIGPWNICTIECKILEHIFILKAGIK
jgi:hypothetical protein